MIPLVEHLPAPTRQREREPDREALHPARERPPVRRLDEEVEVRVLDRRVHHAEVVATEEVPQYAIDRRVVVAPSQIGEPLPCAQRHVHRVSR